ncbi:MAG: PEP-CTERM sorting domain-containing protein [Planctomycetota bacterium]
MKKLFVLIVIINLTSVSQAALIWEVDSITLDIDEVAVVHILSDESLAYSVYMGNDLSPVAEITGVISSYPPDVAEALIFSPGWWTLTALTNGVPTGAHWEVTILGTAAGIYSLHCDYYEDAGPDDILSITVLPEPMTVCLLALGGLFLLRKRRPQT